VAHGCGFISTPWRQTRARWDHDHCEFCGAKFADAEWAEVREGWTAPTEYHWICDQCFRDFRERFAWKVVSMSATVTVYVELLDEGTQCWSPVQAEPLGDGRYRLTGEQPDDETWAFAIDDIVRCEMRELSDGRALVAVAKVG
jgi:hypothetical protein